MYSMSHVMQSVFTHHRRPTPRKGFTLIEAAIVTIIVGVGIVGMLQLLAAGSMANGDATDITTAMNLAAHIHERSLATKYSNIMTLKGASYSPPKDAKLVTITEL